MKTRALLLALPILALSCRDNGASVQIQDICYPAESCQFSNSCDRVLLGNPVIDLALGAGDGSLGLFVQVENQTRDNEDPDTQRTNTNDAHVDEIRIEYESVEIPTMTFFTNQRVPANNTQVIGLVAVPAGYQTQLAAAASEPRAVVRMRGYFDNGSRFETAEFPIAVDLCIGCVVACPADKLVCGGNDGQYPKTCYDPSGAGST
jgi:hypothetical protein